MEALGDLPLAVLASTKMTTFYRDPLQADLPPRLVKLIQETAWQAEVDMSHLSTSSTVTPVERSGQYIQFDRPDAVAAAVRQMVEALQSGCCSPRAVVIEKASGMGYAEFVNVAGPWAGARKAV